MINKLDQAYYDENQNVYEALDTNINGQWVTNKVRGYGVIVIQFNLLTFAVPLRSNIKHNACFITLRNNSQDNVKGKGLDFSKSLLIRDHKYISDQIYRIPNIELNKIREKHSYIKKRFEKYVLKYIKAVENKDQNILDSQDYRFTTLINYHQDLGLE